MALNESTIQVRIDTKTKNQARKMLDEVGLDISSAIKLFLKNVVISQSIPFDIRTKNGFTREQEQRMLEEVEIAKKGRGFKTVEALHKSILGK